VPAHIVVVHDDATVLSPLSEALRRAGHETVVFDDSLAAWDVLKAARTIRLLITRVQFAPGKPHGIALARSALANCPGLRVLFLARPELQEHTEGVGVFMPLPVDINEVMTEVDRLLEGGTSSAERTPKPHTAH
jgi:DNA-binding NtrC family response regulator